MFILNIAIRECIHFQLSWRLTSVTLGTMLMAPPVTTMVGFPAMQVVAALLIWSEVTASIWSQYWWKVRFPKVMKFLAISSSLSSCLSIAIKMFILRMFLALASSYSGIGSRSLWSSCIRAPISSAECDPGPSMDIPKRPESVKWELMELAESTKLYYCIRLVTERQYMPLPGPPEEKAVAEPRRVFMT